ncbi:FtsK/SpoIIIE domain-containing protein [Streptomyces sp. NBC_01794]|uniref:FtsK/SpoIIIE domain-containing protein n=1 Tax=Streptomyces sp. NBC_01794 TaxID=2975942 RepID=UPI003090B462|nr:FtsK/SpoIIIE domain-containing protein [Streptomyces sp. NBC_01794]
MNVQEVYGPGLLLVGVGFVLITLWGVWRIVRYVRADKETRRSIRQAVRIRAGWRRLARMAGLSVTDRTPTFLASLNTNERAELKPRELVPSIATTADRFGVIIRVKLLPKVGIDELQAKARFLAAAWGCVRVSVRPDKPGCAVLRAVRCDPLTTQTAFEPSGQPPDDLTQWPVGVDEYAEPVSIGVKDTSGATVAGRAGGGKSVLLNGLISRYAPSPAVQFAVADGKVSHASEGDYADVLPRLFAHVGDDLKEANDLFNRLVRLRRDRSSVIRRVLGVVNMWRIGPTPSWPLVVVVIDEAHTFFRDHKGSDAKTKKLAALAAENARLVEDLVKKGRSVGIFTVLATQKATGDAIPTFIRDVCGAALSFAQRTTEASVAALGEDIRNWPDADPVALQGAEYVGVASMAVEGREGFTRVRTPWVDEVSVAWVAGLTRHLTQDPARLLAELIGPSLHKVPDIADDGSGAV